MCCGWFGYSAFLYVNKPGELKAGLLLGLQLRYRFYGDDPIPDLIGVMPAKEGFFIFLSLCVPFAAGIPGLFVRRAMWFTILLRFRMDFLKVNGIEKEFEAGELPGTLGELLEYLDVNAATVVAEVDGEIVLREKFGETELRSGQSVELMRLMGGG